MFPSTSASAVLLDSKLICRLLYIFQFYEHIIILLYFTYYLIMLFCVLVLNQNIWVFCTFALQFTFISAIFAGL